MRLAAWAREKGITYKTAWRMYKRGQIPHPTEQLPTGTLLVYPERQKIPPKVAIYARVSSYGQKADLERQLQRLRDYAAVHGYLITQEITEIGSGLNGKRKNLSQVLKDTSFGIIIVEHRDRLMRFGYEYVDMLLRSTGRKLIVLNAEECKDDLVQDMIDVLTSFCGRLYGRRSARQRAKRAMQVIQPC